MVNWFGETLDARGENDDLQAEVAELPRASSPQPQDGCREGGLRRRMLDKLDCRTPARRLRARRRDRDRSPVQRLVLAAADRQGERRRDRQERCRGHRPGADRPRRAVARRLGRRVLLTDGTNSVTARVSGKGPVGLGRVGRRRSRAARLQPRPGGQEVASSRATSSSPRASSSTADSAPACPAEHPDRRDRPGRSPPSRTSRTRSGSPRTPTSTDLNDVTVLTGGPDVIVTPRILLRARRDRLRRRAPAGLLLLRDPAARLGREPRRRSSIVALGLLGGAVTGAVSGFAAGLLARRDARRHSRASPRSR